MAIGYRKGPGGTAHNFYEKTYGSLADRIGEVLDDLLTQDTNERQKNILGHGLVIELHKSTKVQTNDLKIGLDFRHSSIRVFPVQEFIKRLQWMRNELYEDPENPHGARKGSVMTYTLYYPIDEKEIDLED